MLTLAVYYESMVATKTINTQDADLNIVSKVTGVSTRTVREWKKYFEQNDEHRFTKRFVVVVIVVFKNYPNYPNPNPSFLSGEWARGC